MKQLLYLVPLGLLLSCSGCMTNATIREAGRERRPIESLATKNKPDGETNAPLDYPKAFYLLLPFSIPADIVTSPIQLLAFLLWPKC